MKGTFISCGPPTERFWNKVNKTDNCFKWGGSKMSKGYGMFWDGKTGMLAHRFSWELHFGPIPKGMHVLHQCNNRICVRPDHLYLGTDADNSRFMVECDRQAKGEKSGRAKLTEREILEIRDMSGTCKEIGVIYGICLSHVASIKRGRFWKYLA